MMSNKGGTRCPGAAGYDAQANQGLVNVSGAARPW